MNRCLGRALLAKEWGRNVWFADTGAGRHGLATATVAARFGFECTVYMGAVDVEHQRPNVFWMEQWGQRLCQSSMGTEKRLKDAVTAALQDWIAHPNDAYFCLGQPWGSIQYPSMVRDFQSIIGLEVKEQHAAFEGVGCRIT